jgi:uncharacterized NAD-dependent epimerase/dehydratase family protein
MALATPYLMFLGDAPDELAAKTAIGVKHWRPQWCLGQLRLSGCEADLGLPDMSIEQGVAAGCRTLVVGVANRGGVLGGSWIETIVAALEAGLDVASGLHQRLADVGPIADAARAHQRTLTDARHPTQRFAVASGVRRSGKRVLTVGTDVSVGKMYTSLALERALRARGVAADFRATGQTGILVAGDGVSIDAVVADFVSGAAESLSPDNDPEHWDVVEGQGSLHHTSYAGVTLGLIHGTQPDALVVCHDVARAQMRGLAGRTPPTIEACMEAALWAARVVNPGARCIGISLNTKALDADAAQAEIATTAERHALPVVDPVRTGVGPLVEALLA